MSRGMWGSGSRMVKIDRLKQRCNEGCLGRVRTSYRVGSWTWSESLPLASSEHLAYRCNDAGRQEDHGESHAILMEESGHPVR